MLVMFAVGTAVLWWMAALTAIMVYEKTGRRGAAVTRAIGVGLIMLGGLFVLGSVLNDTSVTTTRWRRSGRSGSTAPTVTEPSRQ